MEEFDAIILGSGQGGNPLAKKLSKEGLRVALVESGFIGGTCVNDGCTPTKTLVGMAKDISLASRAGKYGATVNRDTVDYRSISHRKDEVVHYFRKGLEDSLIQDLNIKLFYGKGSFSGYKKLRVLSKNVDSTTITAKKIFINTGARARIPDINGLQSVKYFTSRTLLELDCLPKHLLIIGGGHIALEFSQIFRRMGSLVTIVERSSGLLPREDDDVASEVESILRVDGIEIITDAAVRSVNAASDGSVSAEVMSSGRLLRLSGTHLLIAAGRVPNTEDLDLLKTGIKVDRHGYIPVNDHLETTEPGIYALGDVKGGASFTHVSYNDYVVVADYLFGGKGFSARDRLIPYCLFIDPELGRVGLTEKDARRLGLDFFVAKMKASFIARALETDETRGLLKAVVDNHTGMILGASVLCSGGGELMSLLQVAIMGGITYDQLRDAMFAHPTYAEAVNNLFSPIHIQR